VALVLAHETGHRIGAINKLLWSDVDLEDSQIHWRAENEKTGRAQVTPVTRTAREAPEFARRRSPNIGPVPILPAPKDPTRPIRRDVLQNWWYKGSRTS